MSIPQLSMTKAGAEGAIAGALRNYRFIDGSKKYIIIAPHAQTIQGEFQGLGTYKFQGAAEIKLDTGSEEGASCVKDIKGDAKITASGAVEPVVKINSVSLEKMNEQIQSIIKDIENICVDDTIERFYIGKTANINDRECEHSNNGYANFSEIATGAPDAINNAEKELISYFLESSLKSKLDNENNGGGGSPKADTLYIVFVRKNIQDPNEPDGSLMPSNYPINLK